MQTIIIGTEINIRKNRGAAHMEYLTTENIIIGVIVLLMLWNVKMVIKSDIGDNKVFPIIVIVVLGVGLYLWQSGTGAEIINEFSGTAKNVK